jgi:hypothetical protein
LTGGRYSEVVVNTGLTVFSSKGLLEQIIALTALRPIFIFIKMQKKLTLPTVTMSKTLKFYYQFLVLYKIKFVKNSGFQILTYNDII